MKKIIMLMVVGLCLTACTTKENKETNEETADTVKIVVETTNEEIPTINADSIEVIPVDETSINVKL